MRSILFQKTRLPSAALCAVLVAAFTAGGLRAAAAADTVSAPFYQGKRIQLVIGSSAGGGYDIYARLIGRFLSKHIPGNPTIVISNMAGAGSNVAAAYIASSAPKDGTYVGALYMGAVVEPLFYGKKRATHNPAQFNYIGNANTDYDICVVRSDAPVKSLAETRDTELVIGASAPGGATFDFPSFLKQLLGLKLKIVSGYPGSREVNLALEKGEVQGICGQSWGGVAALYGPMIKDGTLKILGQESGHGHPYLDSIGVPLTMSLATTDAQREIMKLFYEQTSFSRPYAVAKEVPADRVAVLRQAFMDTMRDPELVEEAKRLELDVEATDGEEMQKKLQALYAAPEAEVEVIRKIYAE